VGVVLSPPKLYGGGESSDDEGDGAVVVEKGGGNEGAGDIAGVKDEEKDCGKSTEDE